jgi:CheY-like chemotaxis protein
MSDRHVALIVEDDPHIMAVLLHFVTSLGHGSLLATNLEEVRAAVATGGYCYALLDMQIPADAKSRESVGCGETALRLVRRAAPVRNADDKHVLPILVVTGYSREPHFVAKALLDGADDFIAKPFGDSDDQVIDRIRAALARGRREDHSACEASERDGHGVTRVSTPTSSTLPAMSTPTSGLAAPIRFAIEGTCLAQRNDVLVRGVRGTLPDASFIVLVNAVGAHLRAPGAWESAAKLGMARNRWAPTRIQSELKDLLPEGFRVVEANRPHSFRLNPAIVIERVNWDALSKHPQAAVRKSAAEWGRR